MSTYRPLKKHELDKICNDARAEAEAEQARRPYTGPTVSVEDVFNNDVWFDDGDDSYAGRLNRDIALHRQIQKRLTPQEREAYKARQAERRQAPYSPEVDKWDATMRKFEEREKERVKQFWETWKSVVGRGGMRHGDHSEETFVAYPATQWSIKELKNRIKWLKGQRGRLLGKPGKESALEVNQAKLAKYTKELFQRYSPEGQRKTRDEYNRLRRSRRKIVKTRKIAALMRADKEKRMIERLARHVLRKLESPAPRSKP